MKTPLLLAGTIPSEDIALVTGTVSLHNNYIHIDNKRFPVNRGTAAMAAAACAVASFYGDPMPQGVIGGDIGKRTGSRNVYRYLIKNLSRYSVSVLGLHYIIPDIGLHNQVLTAFRKLHQKPYLIADAGFMYVAKAGGQAACYDLFLPDIGELAFLADEKASHPAYTRGFLTRLENDPVKLHEYAFNTNNSAQSMCVKGAIDYIFSQGRLIDTIHDPVVEPLEAIGGTGDTITGMVIGLVAHGFSIRDACVTACRTNRIAGLLANPSPATQISEIIQKISEALEDTITKSYNMSTVV